MRVTPWTALLGLGLAAAGCGAKSQPKTTDPVASGGDPADPGGTTGDQGATDTAAGKVENRTLADIGLDGTAIDKAVSPCDDFYQYACGAWLARTPVPGDKSRWSRSFDEITERNLTALRAMVEDAAKSPGDDPVRQKVGAFYGACMDEAAVEKEALAGIQPLLDKATAVKDTKSFAAAVATMHRHRVWPLFYFSSGQDARDATQVIGQMHQAGLGLPDRDYYLSTDAKMKGIREKYVAHVEKMLALAGWQPKLARKGAEDVLAIETAIAKVHKTRVELRDPEGVYNRVERKGLAKAAPGFGWDGYFAALEQPDLQQISVTSVPFFTGLDKLLKQYKWPQWRAYLTWQVLDQTAGTLPRAFVDQDFAMVATLSGQEKIEERWKRCLRATDGALGDAVGQMFVKKHFGADAKAAVETMVTGVRGAFAQVLARLEWMDDATRARAKKKLDAMVFQIGYPNKWRSYTFEVDQTKFGANVLAAAAFETERQLAKIGKPVDRDDWLMSPPTVNAYYDPSLNTMVFPAGILQPPFFNAKAPFNVNLGSMGMVVGHELTHGFDDEGSQFDADGNLKSWWEKDVRAKFDERAQCVVEQYNGYKVFPDLALNGKLTLGENIADIAGLKLAYQAHRELQQSARTTVMADGFTPDQQFFLATAQMWCTNIREEAARQRVVTDPHSAARFRVNGPLSNLPEFGEAFSCKAGAPMVPEKTCTVW